MNKSAKISKGQQGDTLIEVLLAMAILSAVIVAVITLMNHGHAMGRDSLERSQVTALMTEQSEMLQYIRDSYANAPQDERDQYPASLWTDLSTTWTAAAEPAGCKTNSKSFFLNRTFVGAGKDLTTSIQAFDGTTINEGSGNYVSTYAKPGSGLWVEAERPAAGSVGVDYVDFHIKGCWSPAGQGPKQEAKTVVRLYMPGEAIVSTGGGGGGGGGGGCSSVASTFSNDITVGAAGSPFPSSVVIPLNGTLKVGCKYEFQHLWGDFHPRFKEECEAGNTNSCNIWKQPYESYYIEFLRADGSVAATTPHTGDIPDVFDPADPDVVYNPNSTSESEAKKLYYNLKITPAVGEITAIKLNHSRQIPTDYKSNSAHLYGYLFDPK